MGGAGHTQAMIAAIKRNKMKPRTSIYDRLDQPKDTRQVNPDYLKEPTPEYWEKLKKEIRIEKRIRALTFLFATIITVFIGVAPHRDTRVYSLVNRSTVEERLPLTRRKYNPTGYSLTSQLSLLEEFTLEVNSLPD